MKVQKRCSRKYIAGKHNEASTGIKQSSAGTLRPQRARLAQTVGQSKAGRAINIRPEKCLHARIHALWIILLSVTLSVFDCLVLFFGSEKNYKILDNVLHSRSHRVLIQLAELSNPGRVGEIYQILNYNYHIKLPAVGLTSEFVSWQHDSRS